MDQTTKIVGIMIFAYIVFTTMKGNLHKYLQVLGLQ